MIQMNEWNKNSEHLLYLISCALRGAEVEESRLDGIDLDRLFVLARKHSVAAMVCMVLEKTDAFAKANPIEKKRWQEAKYKAIRKNMMLDADFEILMNNMENAGIWYMPLKGCVLKDWYPQYGMREMADYDILFDETKREQVKALFLEQGYTAEYFKVSSHDIYHKPPIYNFEMHVSLFNESHDPKLLKKYASVKDSLLPDENRNHRLHFTNEDFYVYVIAHAYKHYSRSGIGIRTLADIYVMYHRIGKSMDWDYVNRELEALGIRAYEERSRLLSEKIFGCGKPLSEITLTEDEWEMLLYYLGSSTYGTIENYVHNRLHSMQADSEPIRASTKLRYFLSRLFPGRNYCINAYPLIYKHPFLLPFFWIWRCFARIPAGKKSIQKELSALKSPK